MASPEPHDERRAAVRARTLLRGRICHGPHFVMSADCQIRNMSTDGALLQIAELQAIPPAFVLVNVSAGVAYETRLVWRHGRLAGVRLGARHDLHAPLEGEMKPLRNIWMALAGS